MGQFVDIRGNIFGRLKVIERTEKEGGIKNHIYWLCECECGNLKIVDGSHLRDKHVRSCGCLQKDTVREMNFKDISGQRFGRLLVLSFAGIQNKKSIWLCQCDCGNIVIRRKEYLNSGDTRSCGCFRKERTSKYRRKGKYESSINALYHSYKKNARNRNLEFYLDKDFFIKITQENCFYCGTSPKNNMKNNCDNGDYIYNGIDRVDNKLGYFENNVVPCCKNCNQAKMDKTEKDFYDWVQKIYLNLKSKDLIF